MTPVQRKLLLALVEYWRNWASSPTVEHLGEQVQLSGSSVRYELYEMEKWGFVKFAPKRDICDKFDVRPNEKKLNEIWSGQTRLIDRIREHA